MTKRQCKTQEEVGRLFAQQLREVRRQRAMTSAEMARQAGVLVSHVSPLQKRGHRTGMDLIPGLPHTPDFYFDERS